MTKKSVNFFHCILCVLLIGTAPSFAKKIDGDISFFIKDGTNDDVETVQKEFKKHFNKVTAFDLKENTDYYLYYIPSAGTAEIELKMEDNTLITERYSKYLQSKNNTYRFESNSNKPYSGSMYLYDSYGDIIFIIRNNDQYKSPKQALERTADLMKKRIDGETQKILAQKTNRCLLCDFNTLTEQQQEQVFEILYLTHQAILPDNFTAAGAEPTSLEPYAALYFSMADKKTLEHILDTNAVFFNHAITYNGDITHIINEAIRQNYSKDLINKIANGYKKNNFKTVEDNILPPLFLATGYQDIDVMQKLIALGADVNQKIAFGNLVLTPLNISAQNGSKETTKLLIKNGAKAGYGIEGNIFPWKIAMWQADYDHAALLWPEIPENPKSQEAQNLLIEAVYHGREEQMNTLLSTGVPLNSTDQNGANILLASIKGIRDFSLAINDDDMESPKHHVNENTYWQLIEKLQNDGLKANILTETDNTGRTALHYAYPEASTRLKNGHLKIIEKILQMGANPAKVDSKGQTANEAYKNARLSYIEQHHKNRLEELAETRVKAGQESQSKEDRIKELALNASKANEKYEKQKKAVLNLKRQSSLNDAKKRAVNQAAVSPDFAFSNFVREESDAQKKLNLYKDELDAANKAAREAYITDAKEADAAYNESVAQENLSYEQQKNDELEFIEQIQKLKKTSS